LHTFRLALTERKAALNVLEALDTLAEEALEMPQHDGVSRIDEAFHNDLKAVQDIWTTALSEADDDRKQEDVVWDEQQAATIESLWNHPSIQHAFENRGRFPFDFGDIEYFFKRLEHLSDPKYVFSVEDITYVRSKTSGVYETKVMVKDCEMIFIDVAGQRSSRKKWISCFSDVTAVIWVSALDNYDQVLFENQSINAMDDALEAFEWAVGHPELEDAVFALFLNKIDLLEKKVANDHFGLKHFFHDYNGEDQNIEHAAEFLKRVFLNCVPDGVHVPAFSVQATDATNANKVLDSVIFGLMSKTVATAF